VPFCVATVTVIAYGAAADSDTVTVALLEPLLPSSSETLEMLTVTLSLSAIDPVCVAVPETV